MEYELLKDYVVALANLHGVIQFRIIVKYYNQQTGQNLTVEKLRDLLHEGLVEDSFIIYGEDFLFEDYLDDDDLMDLIRSQHNKPYYIPEKEELLKYVDTEYFERTTQYRKLLTFIQKKAIKDKDIAREYCEELVMFIKVNEADIEFAMDFLEYFGGELDTDEDLNKFVQLYADMANNTRIKENRGFTPIEMSKIPNFLS